MSDLIIYNEKKNNLNNIDFVKDSKNQIQIKSIENKIYLGEQLSLLITQIYNLSGIKGELNQIQAQDVLKMILTQFKELSLNEIYKAFELERYGSYAKETDHYQLFNAQYVSSILKKYKNWKRQIKKTHNIETLKPVEIPTVTKEEQKKILDSGVIRLYNEFCINKIVPFGNTHIYDYLLEIGNIEKPTGEYRNEIIKRAKKNINKYNSERLKGFKNAIENNNTKLINECKRIALQDYLKKQIEK